MSKAICKKHNIENCPQCRFYPENGTGTDKQEEKPTREELIQIINEMNNALREIYKLAYSNPDAVQDIAFDNWRTNVKP
jgi:hypothetical protein